MTSKWAQKNTLAYAAFLISPSTWGDSIEPEGAIFFVVFSTINIRSSCDSKDGGEEKKTVIDCVCLQWKFTRSTEIHMGCDARARAQTRTICPTRSLKSWQLMKINVQWEFKWLFHLYLFILAHFQSHVRIRKHSTKWTCWNCWWVDEDSVWICVPYKSAWAHALFLSVSSNNWIYFLLYFFLV